jgi:RimJ/RimL family protein N-acetyltransferase
VLLDRADPSARLYPPRAAATEQRLEFCSRRATDPAFTRLLNHRPGGCDVHAIDRESFPACQWQQDLLSVFGSAERFLHDSLGFGVFYGGVLVSEAHAFFWGGSLVEIGAITKAAYRGRGYATLAAAHLIHGCEERGYITYWGCDVENPASAAVARRLGYGEPRAYTLEFYPMA